MAALRASALTLLAAAHAGCATVEAADRALYETTESVASSNPVTGRPVLNVLSEEREVELAQQMWAQIVADAATKGIAVDPPGPRLDQVRIVFDRLVGVAHRQELPWEVHLVGLSDVNAFTPGGGMVVVLDGLFGGLVPPGDDDALAAVLAHEVAHVALLHPPARATWAQLGPLVAKKSADPYYQAAYSTEQEAEADKLGVLYMALAGFDPQAAPRIWATAHQRSGSSAARSHFLHDHPLNVERMASTRQVAAQVSRYLVRGERNPDWNLILADNSLFPRQEDREYEPGQGLVRALEAAGDTWLKHEQARAEEKRRKAELQRLNQAVRILRVFEAPTADGYAGIFVDLYNGSSQEIAGVTIWVHYYRGQQPLGTDSSCQVAVSLPPGGQHRVGCYKRAVTGSTGTAAQVATWCGDRAQRAGFRGDTLVRRRRRADRLGRSDVGAHQDVGREHPEGDRRPPEGVPEGQHLGAPQPRR